MGRQTRVLLKSRVSNGKTDSQNLPQQDFAHNSEREFARYLDFYGVQWLYEPVCFPLSRYADGSIRESFTPDFYLPQFDLFVELTTMRQRLVTRKNGKIRRFRDRFPELRLRVLYRRDVRSLQFKFLASHGIQVVEG